VELFERIGWFFARLETYTEVAPTTAMTNIITEIMVEVLNIFGIATKELRRGSASEFYIGCVRIFTKPCKEKFLRKLAGMADLEDALKKLDRLTQEEARMAHAEVLRITHSIRNEVKMVDGKVEKVEDKVGGVGDKVEEVSDKVEDIDAKVQRVDDKVQVVIHGALYLFSQCLKPFLRSIPSDSKQARVAAQETRLIIQRTANDMNEIKRS
jgi:archaellum component FlaC